VILQKNETYPLTKTRFVLYYELIKTICVLWISDTYYI